MTMRTNKSYSAIVGLALVLGIGLLGTAQRAAAQDSSSPRTEKNKEKKERAEEKEKKEGRKAEEELVRQATLTKEQARAIALQKVPGIVQEEEIEKENGMLVWSFDIKDSTGKIFDVKIDAKTGAVLSSSEDREDENGKPSDDRNGKRKNILEKIGGGIKHTTAKVYRKIRSR